MARLTYEEKFKIMNAISNGETIESISTNLSRSVSAIKNYVDNELPKFIDSLQSKKSDNTEDIQQELEQVKSDLKQALSELAEYQTAVVETTNDNQIQLLDDIVTETIIKLKRDGVKEEDARNSIRIVASKLTERLDDSSRLRVLCLRQMNLHNSMITSAVGGHSGVTAMTQAASQIADHKKSNSRRQSSRTTVDPYIFRPKTNDTV